MHWGPTPTTCPQPCLASRAAKDRCKVTTAGEQTGDRNYTSNLHSGIQHTGVLTSNWAPLQRRAKSFKECPRVEGAVREGSRLGWSSGLMERVFSGFSGTPLVHSQGPAREQESSPQGDMRGCEPLGVTHTTSSHTIEAGRGGRSEPGGSPSLLPCLSRAF